VYTCRSSKNAESLSRERIYKSRICLFTSFDLRRADDSVVCVIIIVHFYFYTFFCVWFMIQRFSKLYCLVSDWYQYPTAKQKKTKKRMTWNLCNRLGVCYANLKEHQKAVEHKQPQKSALAEDCLPFGHSHILGVVQDLIPVQAQICVTDAFWNHGRLISARIRSIGTTAFICRMSI